MMKLIFLHADKRESLRQIGTMILMGVIKHSQSSHYSKFAMSLQFLKKELRNREFIFCMQINIKFSSSWDYRFLVKVARHV